MASETADAEQMLNARAPETQTKLGWIIRSSSWRTLIALFAFVLLVFVLVPVWHSVRGHSTKDYWVWFQTGRTVLNAGEIYPDRFHKFPFMYPPPCALFLAPISALGQTGQVRGKLVKPAQERFVERQTNTHAWWRCCTCKYFTQAGW